MDIRGLIIVITGLLVAGGAEGDEHRICDSFSERIPEIQDICMADLDSHAGTYFVRTWAGLLPVPTSMIVDSRATDRYSLRARNWSRQGLRYFGGFISIFNQFDQRERLAEEGKILQENDITSMLLSQCGIDARLIVYEGETPGGITLRQLWLDIEKQLVSVAYEDRDILQAMVERLVRISCGDEEVE